MRRRRRTVIDAAEAKRRDDESRAARAANLEARGGYVAGVVPYGKNRGRRFDELSDGQLAGCHGVAAGTSTRRNARWWPRG